MFQQHFSAKLHNRGYSICLNPALLLHFFKIRYRIYPWDMLHETCGEVAIGFNRGFLKLIGYIKNA